MNQQVMLRKIKKRGSSLFFYCDACLDKFKFFYNNSPATKKHAMKKININIIRHIIK